MLLTEVEFNAVVSSAQDMMYALRVLEAMELQVELPMLREIDNRRLLDLENNWSFGGRTCHIETHQR